MRRRRDPNLQRFLLDGERVVIDVRQHWGVIAVPVLCTLAGLVVVLWVDAHIHVDAGGLARVLWLLWFVLLGWMVFQIIQWRHDRFIATDKRLLLDYGLFTQKVAMMPLIKVTDMSYQRSVPGRLLGYGRFVLESAGQDQALHQVDWVPHPDTTYRIICTRDLRRAQPRTSHGPRPRRRLSRRRHRGLVRLGLRAGGQPAEPHRYAVRPVRGRRALVLLAGDPAAPAGGLVTPAER